MKKPAQRSFRAEWKFMALQFPNSLFCLLILLLALSGCKEQSPRVLAKTASAAQSSTPSYAGFDLNLYPSDADRQELRKQFAFVGFWLNNPPGERSNAWLGRRGELVREGFGFVVLWNGRLDAAIKRSRVSPEMLGQQDAAAAIASARKEGFPVGTILFLDQEEGGRLLAEQAGYFFGFTEAVAKSGYRAGAYLSGQRTPDDPAPDGSRRTITTAEDVQQTIQQKHLAPVAMWVAEDTCPPAPGCVVDRSRMERFGPQDSGTPGALVWQYAQSPRRPELTRACRATYAADGSCYASAKSRVAIDLDLAASPDPSHGR